MSAERKQQALLAQVRVAMNHLTASKQRMRTRAMDDRARLPQMLDEARAELVTGRSDLARASLRRRHVVALELATLETQLGEVEKDETNLLMLERRLANQVDEFVARQQVVIARYNAAEAQVQIKEAVTGVSREFAELTSALVQAEERTEGMEARVSAINRLVTDCWTRGRWPRLNQRRSTTSKTSSLCWSVRSPKRSMPEVARAVRERQGLKSSSRSGLAQR